LGNLGRYRDKKFLAIVQASGRGERHKKGEKKKNQKRVQGNGKGREGAECGLGVIGFLKADHEDHRSDGYLDPLGAK